MREILFKAKCKDRLDLHDSERWVEGDFIHLTDTRDTAISSPKFIDEIVEVDPETISEYTGKTDSNGRRIFENDIVRVHSRLLNESYIAVVKFGEYGDGFHNGKGHMGFYLDFSCDNYFRKDFGYWLEACEVRVIGNVFDKGSDDIGKGAEET